MRHDDADNSAQPFGQSQTPDRCQRARCSLAAPARAQRSFATARSNTLTLVAVNDVYDLEHLPKLRTLVDAVKAEREGTVITTLAGDFLSPSVLSSLDRGRGMVQVLNAVGIEYACLGNHEADVGLVPGAVVGRPSGSASASSTRR